MVMLMAKTQLSSRYITKKQAGSSGIKSAFKNFLVPRSLLTEVYVYIISFPNPVR